MSAALHRREVVKALLAQRGDALVVAGLGSTAWDCAAAGDSPLTFPLWGAMGAAAMVGLGLAIAQPARRVLVITGDGEMLMGLGSLATIGVQSPRNLAIVVIDNERYGETGMQTSHTGHGIDFDKVAAACGFASTRTVSTLREVEDLAETLRSPSKGPRFFVIKVAAENPPRSLPSRDAVYIKNRFRAHLGFPAG